MCHVQYKQFSFTSLLISHFLGECFQNSYLFRVSDTSGPNTLQVTFVIGCSNGAEMKCVAFKVPGLILIIRVLMFVFNGVPKVLFTSSLRFANCEGNLAFQAATIHFLAICSCGGRQRTFWESAENKQEQAGEFFKSSTYQRDALVPSCWGE